MTKNEVSYRDLYSLVDSRTAEIMDKFDRLEVRVNTLERWQSNIMGKLAIVATVITVSVSFVIAEIRSKLKI
jgi:ketopantoate reductase